MAANTVGVVVSTQIVARLYPRVGPRRLMAGGLVWMATAIILLALVGAGGAATDPAAYRAAFLVAALFALIGSLLALRVPDALAAETMRARQDTALAAPRSLVASAERRS